MENKKAKRGGAGEDTGTPGRKKTYSNIFQTQAAILDVLARQSSREHPMSVKEICDELERQNRKSDSAEEYPSRNTVVRYLSGQTEGLNALMAVHTLQRKGEPGIRHTYTHGGKLHVVLENADGELLRETEMTAVVTPALDVLPSYSTVSKLLLNYPDMAHMASEPPLRLRCLRAKRQPDGRVTYIPYDMDKNEAESREAGRSQAKEQDKDKHGNQARYYYLESVLTPEQWGILADMVCFFPYLSGAQTESYLSVLNRLSPGCAAGRGKLYSSKRERSGRFFQHVRTLKAAIAAQCKVTVQYGEYVLEKSPTQWRPALRKRKKTGLLTAVEPYALAWSNGFYYLVCRDRGMMNLRVDRILSVTVHPKEHFTLPPTFDPTDYCCRTPVMYAGEPQAVRFRCKAGLLNKLVDYFGDLPRYSEPAGDWVEASLQVSLSGAKRFAMQYADSVEILSPPELREELARTFGAAARRYGAQPD